MRGAGRLMADRFGSGVAGLPPVLAVADWPGLAAVARGADTLALAVVAGPERFAGCLPRAGRERGRTRFEIGSITKTFTALLLADLVADGVVRLEDPVALHLPARAGPRHQRGAPITLLHLATHTAGLPRLPARFYPVALPAWRTNPYAAYGPELLLRDFARVRPRSAPGRFVRYSNFGVGLLGRALAEAAGRPYEQVLAERVLRPLGLHETGGQARYAAGHAPGYAPGHAAGYAPGHAAGLLGPTGATVPPWRIPGLPGAGCLVTGAGDLLRYLEALLAPDGAGALAGPLREVQRPRLVRRGSADRLCLVWNLRHYPWGDLLFHSGGTRGFTTFIGFSPQRGVGLAVSADVAPDPRGRFLAAAYGRLRVLAEGG